MSSGSNLRPVVARVWFFFYYFIIAALFERASSSCATYRVGKQTLTFEGEVKPAESKSRETLAKTFSLANKRMRVVAKKEDVQFKDCSVSTYTDCVKAAGTNIAKKFACIAKCPSLKSWADVESTSNSVTVYYQVFPRRTEDAITCEDMYVLVYAIY